MYDECHVNGLVFSPTGALNNFYVYLQNSLMGSPIVAGRIASPGSQSPSSLPYDVPTSYGSGNGVSEKNRTRSITEASTSRGPVSKVMDMFRNRSQSVSTDDKRKVMDDFLFQLILGSSVVPLSIFVIGYKKVIIFHYY